MRHRSICTALLVACAVLGAQEAPPEGLLTRIRAKARENLTRLPDYTCLQTVERSRRSRPGEEFRPFDTLKLEVGLAGDREVFAWRGSKQFSDKELADMVGSGTIGNGNFGLHVKNVFLSTAPEFTYEGVKTRNGKQVYHYTFEVPQELSTYEIRVPPRKARVPFHGAFWVDAETLDLMRLEVDAEDIPDALGLARASDAMDYARMQIGNSSFLLPRASELLMAGLSGDESRNRTEFTGCRQYVGESSLRFETEEAKPPRTPAVPDPGRRALAPRTAFELALETEIDPETAAAGDPLKATLSSPIKDGEQIVVPAGTPVTGRLVRIEKQALPFPHYIVAVEFHTLQGPAGPVEFTASMEKVHPTAGLIQQARSMNPVFKARRERRFDILVSEHQRGQGVVHWDAKRRKIPTGLRMRWIIEPPE